MTVGSPITVVAGLLWGKYEGPCKIAPNFPKPFTCVLILSVGIRVIAPICLAHLSKRQSPGLKLLIPK
jgi:hypothetical protein